MYPVYRTYFLHFPTSLNRATSSSVGVPPATALVWFKASSASQNLGSGMEAWYHPIKIYKKMLKNYMSILFLERIISYIQNIKSLDSLELEKNEAVLSFCGLLYTK